MKQLQDENHELDESLDEAYQRMLEVTGHSNRSWRCRGIAAHDGDDPGGGVLKYAGTDGCCNMLSTGNCKHWNGMGSNTQHSRR